MFNKIINKLIFLFDFNSKVKAIMDTGIKVCFVFTLISVLIMSLYITTNHSYILYDLGIRLFKTSTTFIAIFLICGIAFNKIIKDRR